MPTLADYPLDGWRDAFETDVVAPLALIQLALGPLQAADGRVVNITSDAAVEGYEGWGGYGAAKAALEQLSRVLAAEHPELGVYWVDPGDMRTAMHQDAFPGEDISDRPPPESSVPGLLALVLGDFPSGRYVARDRRGGGVMTATAFAGARLPPGLSFELPSVLEATEPPEVRGRGRDDVRLLVSVGTERPSTPGSPSSPGSSIPATSCW